MVEHQQLFGHFHVSIEIHRREPVLDIIQCRGIESWLRDCCRDGADVLADADSVEKSSFHKCRSPSHERVDDAVDWADNQPYPEPEDCMTDVYDEG